MISIYYSSCWKLAILSLLLLLDSGDHLLADDHPAKNRPNVLFLLSDDQQPDTIHALGNSVINTPHLDGLVRSGTSFSKAICANPICTPSRAEILSGCDGFTNGVIDFGRRIDPGLTLWPEAMQNAGYETGYVGKWHNDGRPIDRRFEKTPGLFSGGGGKWYEPQTDWKGMPVTGYRGWIFQSGDGKEKYPDKGVGLTPNISEKFADAAIGFLKEERDKPFFLQVNFTAPHDPLFLPPEFEEMYDPENIPLPVNYYPQHPFDHGNFAGRDEVLLPFPRSSEIVKQTIAVYYAVISHMDREIGRILQALRDSGEYDNTIIVFSSDHGLGVGRHGLRGKQSMYEHTINVPLIVAGPGLPQNERTSAQVYLRDLYPTICELSGINIPDSVTAISFAPILRGERDAIHPYVVGYFRDKQRMIRSDRWKLIEYPHLRTSQLFDLEHDPYELRNLAGERPRVENMLRAELKQWGQSKGDPVYSESQPSR
ncbi:MAG: sulfatase-like hydrolase/transferase [Planctomycetaceae bacterium]|jgi:arylsulfatase A-like enzyme|nr:sulfatase-like hydrolase/transferase [bacterium]MDC0273433.1 sulfatase-like hydrolase/transferase [Planctomycetaceae bacterium]MDC0308525.1 sulfatase-like hydrolase/transferase [Planctomycetaceae bacterium]MDG2388276.1 sulfatase-like hydrolase/transferase [Planctomycetaceae bacterium]